MIDQLLAKAMSTSSEDEAMSCLRMARKKNGGKTINVNVGGQPQQTKSSSSSGSGGTFNGNTAKHWYEKAYYYYHRTQSLEQDMKIAARTIKAQAKTLQELQSGDMFWRVFGCVGWFLFVVTAVILL